MFDTTPITASVSVVAASSSAPSDSVNAAAAETTKTTAVGASPAASSAGSMNVCSGNRSHSAATTPLTPASHGPVTRTTSRRCMVGAPSRGPIAATIASTASAAPSAAIAPLPAWSVTLNSRPLTIAAASP
jgi:hypothetical protein